MWYGLTKKNIIHGLILMCILGAVAALAGLIGTHFSKPGPRNYWALLYFAAIPGIWLVLVSILTITWLKVDDGWVEWYLWKRFRILRCPVSQITHIGGGSFSAVVIRTRRGTIRLFGLHLRDRMKLSEHLLELNPNIKWRD